MALAKLIVGLGNPGPRYAPTRHNIGFRLVAALAQRLRVPLVESGYSGHLGVGELDGVEVGLLLPTTFMNHSGQAVAALLADHPGIRPEQDLLVAYDDLDLPFGRIRLRPRGGAGGHRGVQSLIDELGGQDFGRLRFGVGRPAAGVGVVDHVLAPFLPEEEAALPACVERAADAMEIAISESVGAAMNAFNRDTAEPPVAPRPEEEGAPRSLIVRVLDLSKSILARLQGD